MRIDILTVVPDLLTSPLNESILRRAQEKGLAEIVVHNIRDYTTSKHGQVDDYPFGGEAGMVMMIEPVYRLIEKLKSERHYDEIIFTSPDGATYNQQEANHLSTMENIIILCGHYKGIDYRIRVAKEKLGGYGVALTAVGAFCFSRLGLTKIVNYAYPVIAVFGGIYVIFCLTFIIKKRYKKDSVADNKNKVFIVSEAKLWQGKKR